MMPKKDIVLCGNANIHAIFKQHEWEKNQYLVEGVGVGGGNGAPLRISGDDILLGKAEMLEVVGVSIETTVRRSWPPAASVE